MLNITIHTENAAYNDGSNAEIISNLKEITEKIECGYTAGSVIDINGNKTGNWSLDED